MLKASLIMTGISIVLLVIYGSDVAVGGGTGEGFLGPDHVARGIGLGMPAVILPLISFFISRKEKSSTLGIMLVVSGVLILIGGAVVIGMEPSPEVLESGRNVMAEAGPLIGVGALIVALGALKLKKSKSSSN